MLYKKNGVEIPLNRTMELELNPQLVEIQSRISGLYERAEKTENPVQKLIHFRKMHDYVLTKRELLQNDPIFKQLTRELKREIISLEGDFLETGFSKTRNNWTMESSGMEWKFSPAPRIFIYQVLGLIGIVLFNVSIGNFYFNLYAKEKVFHYLLELLNLLLAEFLFLFFLGKNLIREFVSEKITVKIPGGGEFLEVKIEYKDEDLLLGEILILTTGQTSFAFLMSLNFLLYFLCGFLDQQYHLDYFGLNLNNSFEIVFIMGILAGGAGYLMDSKKLKQTQKLLRELVFTQILKKIESEHLSEKEKLLEEYS